MEFLEHFNPTLIDRYIEYRSSICQRYVVSVGIEQVKHASGAAALPCQLRRCPGSLVAFVSEKSSQEVALSAAIASDRRGCRLLVPLQPKGLVGSAFHMWHKKLPEFCKSSKSNSTHLYTKFCL